MHLRKIRLFFIFIVLFSLRGFSQTDQSEHPLLDKYYPQAKKDTAKTLVKENSHPFAPKPEVFPVAPVAKQLPPVTPLVVKPVAAEEINTPAVTTTPTPTSITSAQSGNSTPIAAISSLEKPQPVVTSDTATVVSPAPVVQVKSAAVQEVIQPRSPAPPPYMDTRLGSSTKQYDTYEKNSNGAGSVTTSPK